MLDMKKARLVEEQMDYEELVMEENFSDDEITATLNRRLLKERVQLLCLQQVRRMVSLQKAHAISGIFWGHIRLSFCPGTFF